MRWDKRVRSQEEVRRSERGALTASIPTWEQFGMMRRSRAQPWERMERRKEVSRSYKKL